MLPKEKTNMYQDQQSSHFIGYIFHSFTTIIFHSRSKLQRNISISFHFPLETLMQCSFSGVCVPWL